MHRIAPTEVIEAKETLLVAHHNPHIGRSEATEALVTLLEPKLRTHICQ